jgi:hypothetical protein
MRRRFLALAIVLTLGSLALAAGANASAAGAVTVSGAYSVSDLGTTTCAPVGTSGFMFRCDTAGLVSQYTGDLVGTAVADFTSLINCATGKETGHGSETFAGTLAGFGSGMLVWTDQFSADVDCSFAPDFFIPFNLDIKSVAVKGSGGFSELQGKLTFTDTTYSGRLQ